MRSVLRLLMFFAPWPAPMARAAEPGDLELVLLADASGSIDDGEIMFQRQGYAEEAARLSLAAGFGSIGLGEVLAFPVPLTAPSWLLMAEIADARQRLFEDGTPGPEALIRPPRIAYGRNAIGAALLTGKRLIEENAFEGNRRVIDFSADSANNWYPPDIGEARAEVLDAGIVINGLAVLCRECWSGRPVSYDLEKAFADQIIGGPGSFVVTADDAPSFAAAVRKKLILEIAGLPARFAAAGR